MEEIEIIPDPFIENAVDKEQEFYSSPFYFSYSSLSTLVWNPMAFYNAYVLGIREKKEGKALTEGTLVHKFILEPEKVEQDYIILPTTLPKENIQSILQEAHNKMVEQNLLLSYKDAKKLICESIASQGYYAHLTDDKKPSKEGIQLSKIEKQFSKLDGEEARNYWKYIITKEDKTCVDVHAYERCKYSANVINQKYGNYLIGDEIYNEKEIKLELVNMPFGLKGIIDNISIHHTSKMIYINDIKTTSKSVTDFKESVEFYSYWMQCDIYYTLVVSYFKELIQEGYQVEFSFIVVDKFFQCYRFVVSTPTLVEWDQRMYEDVFPKALWHYNSRDYTLPYEYANNLIKL